MAAPRRAGSGAGSARRARGRQRAEPLHVEVDDRRGVERQQLRDEQAADDGDAERPAQLRRRCPCRAPAAAPPSSAAMVVIMIGPEAQQARLVDRLVAATCPRSRSASSAKSIIMIAFFFTMPMSRMMPMSAMTLNSVPAEHQRQERAHARRRQRRQDRDRVDVALVEHAEHDVDGEERGQDQERLGRQRLAERLRRALEVAVHAGRQADLALGARGSRSTASPSETPGREVERQRHRRELALVVDRQRRAARVVEARRTPTSGTGSPVGGAHVDAARARPGPAGTRARPRGSRGTG